MDFLHHKAAPWPARDSQGSDLDEEDLTQHLSHEDMLNLNMLDSVDDDDTDDSLAKYKDFTPSGSESTPDTDFYLDSCSEDGAGCDRNSNSSDSSDSSQESKFRTFRRYVLCEHLLLLAEQTAVFLAVVFLTDVLIKPLTNTLKADQNMYWYPVVPVLAPWLVLMSARLFGLMGHRWGRIMLHLLLTFTMTLSGMVLAGGSWVLPALPSLTAASAAVVAHTALTLVYLQLMPYDVWFMLFAAVAVTGGSVASLCLLLLKVEPWETVLACGITEVIVLAHHWVFFHARRNAKMQDAGTASAAVWMAACGVSALAWPLERTLGYNNDPMQKHGKPDGFDVTCELHLARQGRPRFQYPNLAEA